METVEDKRQELLRIVLVRSRELLGKANDLFLSSLFLHCDVTDEPTLNVTGDRKV